MEHTLTFNEHNFDELVVSCIEEILRERKIYIIPVTKASLLGMAAMVNYSIVHFQNSIIDHFTY